ncbi:MAG: hypothetical protein EON84_12740 [Bradyrhizobiaceae bacterium]|nr:MAG: hypothetical protein EON84_12740 [Bradyrhizobiaceae bacterium]
MRSCGALASRQGGSRPLNRHCEEPLRRSNPVFACGFLDCRVAMLLAMTGRGRSGGVRGGAHVSPSMTAMASSSSAPR